AWAVYGLKHPGTLPAPAVVGLLAEVSFVPIAMAMVFLLLVFPTGALVSERWRPARRVIGVAGVLLLVAFVIEPRELLPPGPGGVSASVRNPAGITGFGTSVLGTAGTINGLSIVFLAGVVIAVASLVIRYRAGTRTVRQQIKWLALVAAVAAVSQG